MAAEKTAVKKGRILSQQHILFSMVRECVSMDKIFFLVRLNQAPGERCIVLEAAGHKKKSINKRFFHLKGENALITIWTVSRRKKGNVFVGGPFFMEFEIGSPKLMKWDDRIQGLYPILQKS